MRDWSEYSALPTEQTIGSYPTVLDILKSIVAESEEMQKMRTPFDRLRDGFGYNWFRVGFNQLVRSDKLGINLMAPTSRTPNILFRGQSRFYDKCMPSLFRSLEKEYDGELLRSRIQIEEMKGVMGTHPVIQFIKSTPVSVNGIGNVPISIMYEGLAQHYGIKTHYLDLTNDIWTAAFFASTIYENGEYRPVFVDDRDFNDSFGVLYMLDYEHDTRYGSYENDDIIPIGLQYFNRPGRQCGFVRDMTNVRDLHSLPNLQKIFFRHDHEASKLIFQLSQNGRHLFPADSLAEIVAQIRISDRISKASVDMVYRQHYSDMSRQGFDKKIASIGYSISEEYCASFSPECLEADWQRWINGERDRFLHEIDILPIFKL